jgi:hypothetical protein
MHQDSLAGATTPKEAQNICCYKMLSKYVCVYIYIYLSIYLKIGGSHLKNSA